MDATKKTAGITSLTRSLEPNLIEDPEGLRFVPLIVDAATESRQVAVATLMGRGVPRRVLAEIMGCSLPNVTQLANAGARIIAEREELAGVERFPAAARDRKRRETVSAAIREAQRREAAGAEITDAGRLAG